MKVGIVVLLVCEVFLSSILIKQIQIKQVDAAHHATRDLSASASKFFGAVNVPKKPNKVTAKPTKTIAPVKPTKTIAPVKPTNAIAPDTTNTQIEPPVANSEDEVMGHEMEGEVMGNEMEGDVMGHEMEGEVMGHEMEGEVMVHEMGDEAMVHEMGDEAIADVMKPVMDMENILHMENHMEMHHSKDNSNHVRLLLPHLSNLVSSNSEHAVMHDSDHTTTQPNGQSTSHITDIQTSPSKGLKYAQPKKYNYKSTGYVPPMVKRMSNNVYKPQMYNHGKSKQQYSTSGYGKSQPYVKNHYGTSKKQYPTKSYGKSQAHYYSSLNNIKY